VNNFQKKKQSRDKLSFSLFNRSKKEFLLWFFFGLIVSLLIHLFIIRKAGYFEISSFNPTSFDSVIPRRFHLERVEIDPNLLENPEKKEVVQQSKPQEIILLDKDKVLMQGVINDYGAKPDTIDTKESSEEKPGMLGEIFLIPEKLQENNKPELSFDKIGKKTNSPLKEVDYKEKNTIKNYSQLDDLIEKKVKLTSQTPPILLPTDFLFEYDSDQLKKEAEQSLKKLAQLIKKNSNAEFIIKGFADNFGSDEYNLDLSSRRANSLKKWLITKQLIDLKQIKASGFGKSHFIVPSTGNIEEQSLNRRVEIVIQKTTP